MQRGQCLVAAGWCSELECGHCPGEGESLPWGVSAVLKGFVG